MKGKQEKAFPDNDINFRAAKKKKQINKAKIWGHSITHRLSCDLCGIDSPKTLQTSEIEARIRFVNESNYTQHHRGVKRTRGILLSGRRKV